MRQLAELNETVSSQAITMHQLDIEVEDLKNREYQKNSSLQKQKII